MQTRHSIVAAVDFSEESRHAAERAAVLAREQQAQLDLLHVISRPALHALDKFFPAHADVQTKVLDQARRTLDELNLAIGAQAPAASRACVKIGRVVEEVLVASERSDLLVLGAHGSNSMRDVILGTTAERLLGKSKPPVLVTKRRPTAAYARVIVPVDFSPCSVPSLAMARWIAPSAGITIVHAFHVPLESSLRMAGATDESIERYCDEERQEAGKHIQDLIQIFKQDAPRISYTVECGQVSRVILKKENELSADLIVIGKHGRSVIEELLLGSVTRHVLAGSTCDVLVVHEGHGGR
jgi:nucleotide-binding universal stress UspA family protein